MINNEDKLIKTKNKTDAMQKEKLIKSEDNIYLTRTLNDQANLRIFISLFPFYNLFNLI